MPAGAATAATAAMAMAAMAVAMAVKTMAMAVKTMAVAEDRPEREATAETHWWQGRP